MTANLMRQGILSCSDRLVPCHVSFACIKITSIPGNSMITWRQGKKRVDYDMTTLQPEKDRTWQVSLWKGRQPDMKQGNEKCTRRKVIETEEDYILSTEFFSVQKLLKFCNEFLILKSSWSEFVSLLVSIIQDRELCHEEKAPTWMKLWNFMRNVLLNVTYGSLHIFLILLDPCHVY